MLPPVEAGGGEPLQAIHLVDSILLEAFERSGYRLADTHGLREGDGVFHRHLRSRTHREVGGVRCVADERHRAGHPAARSPSAEPCPPTAIAEQGKTVEVLGEHVGENLETVFVAGTGGLAHVKGVEPSRLPGRLVALDDERRRPSLTG